MFTVNLKQENSQLFFFFTSKMGLFRSSKELQFRTCNYGEPHVSPIKQRKGNSFIERRRNWEGLLKTKRLLQETRSLR